MGVACRNCGLIDPADMPVAAGGLMILEAALVSPQAFLDALGRLVGAGIGVSGYRFSLEHDARIKMDHAFRAEAEPVLADGHVAGKAAVEIFGRSLANALA